MIPIKLYNWLIDRENERISGMLLHHVVKVEKSQVVYLTEDEAAVLANYLAPRLDNIDDLIVWKQASRLVGRLTGATPYTPALNI